MEKRYQVFISSTFRDLEEERKEVMEAIINMNCFPAGMEMFPATDTEQFEYIKKIIDESDYYVIILAGKYGSLADDGISFTEKEFDYAKEKKIPILSFVMEDLGSVPAKKVESDPERREKLDAFRTKVLSGRLAVFWKTSLELKYKLTSSLTKEFKIHPRTGWIRGYMSSNEEFLEQIKNELQKTNFNSELERLSKITINMDYYIKDSEKLTRNWFVSSFPLSKLIKRMGYEFLSGIDIERFYSLLLDFIKHEEINAVNVFEKFESEQEDFYSVILRLSALKIIDIDTKTDHILLTEFGKEYLDDILLREMEIEHFH